MQKKTHFPSEFIELMVLYEAATRHKDLTPLQARRRLEHEIRERLMSNRAMLKMLKDAMAWRAMLCPEYRNSIEKQYQSINLVG